MSVNNPGLHVDVGRWTPEDVKVWLEAALAARFPGVCFGDPLTRLQTVHLIDGPLLLTLTGSEWKEAMPSIGARKVLKKEVQGLAAALRPGPSPEHTEATDPPQIAVNEPPHKTSPPRKAAGGDCAASDKPSPRSPAGSPRVAAHKANPGGLTVDSGPSSVASFIKSRMSLSTDAGPPPRERRRSRVSFSIDSALTLEGILSPEHFSKPFRARQVLQALSPRSLRGRRNSDGGGAAATAAKAPSVARQLMQALSPKARGAPLRPPLDPLGDAPPPPAAAAADGTATPPAADPAAPGPPNITSPTAFSEKSEADVVRQSSFVSTSVVGLLGSKASATGHRQDLLWGRHAPPAAEYQFGTPHPRHDMFASLMEASSFSNLPIIDCHYKLDAAPSGSSCLERFHFHRLLMWCRATYFFSCLFRLLDRWQLLWCVACCGAVVFCKTFNLTATFPTGIWVNVLLFPLAFSVNAAYRRREGALALSAEFKATCLSLYLSHRCWQFEESVPHDFLPSSCACFTALFDSVRGYLTAQTEHRKKHELRLLYDIFSELSLVNDVLRISGLPAPLSASLTATLANVISSFERLRMFSDYRTPSSIRAFIHLCVVLVPLLLIPVFAELATQYHPLGVYVASFLLPFPFMLLANVQKGLENPFCGKDCGADRNPDGIQLDGLQMVNYMSDVKLTSGIIKRMSVYDRKTMGATADEEEDEGGQGADDGQTNDDITHTAVDMNASFSQSLS